jgi:CBS domain-containing protein
MRDADVGAVVVTDSTDGAIGVLTDRDIVVRAVAVDMDTILTPVRDIPSAAAVSLHPDDAIGWAEELVRRHAIRRLAVVDRDGTIVGILSLGDLATDADVGEALADISAAPPNR